ncbi:alpha/beta hydrolase family esterase [Nocardia sp. alder85J]|uniref:alpha/beta hydrolase family esterase n=1 Tax=Nocardia sp. alder85J TaxID=2862949 RepID=UPI002258C907|nr:hypothetical protein [Nocardia sp. alder85J]MCX4090845.1 hypothetical protein [Nocardia sp. alder85J]
MTTMNSIPLRRSGAPHRLRQVVGALAAVAAAVAAFGTGSVPAAHAEAAAVASAGCATPDRTAPGSSTLPFASGGQSGHYILDVPAGATGPLPLVLDLHGYLEPAEIQRTSSGLGEFGSTHGFLTITPQLDEPGFPRWDFTPGQPDVDWLSTLLTQVESTQCVDQRRVYAAGLSMGAFTSSALACRLSDRIAAVAPVAGLQDFQWCHPTRPVPIVAFHGTSDPIIAYTGGIGPNARYLPSPDGSGSAVRQQPGGPGVDGPGPQSIPDIATAWARRNGCGDAPTEQHVTRDVDLTTYPCPPAGTVELYSVLGGGHTWPGSSFASPEPLTGSTTQSISADAIIWDFFQAHPLP